MGSAQCCQHNQEQKSQVIITSNPLLIREKQPFDQIPNPKVDSFNDVFFHKSYVLDGENEINEDEKTLKYSASPYNRQDNYKQFSFCQLQEIQSKKQAQDKQMNEIDIQLNLFKHKFDNQKNCFITNDLRKNHFLQNQSDPPIYQCQPSYSSGEITQKQIYKKLTNQEGQAKKGILKKMEKDCSIRSISPCKKSVSFDPSVQETVRTRCYQNMYRKPSLLLLSHIKHLPQLGFR